MKGGELDLKKKYAIATLVVTLAGIGLLGSTKALAADTSTSPMSSLVQKIADTFGLKTTDVQAVFDQNRAERKAQMEASYSDRLAKLVTDGKITEAQKQLILAKNKELQTKRESVMQSMQGKTQEERKAAMEANRANREAEKTALEQWAKQNGIDIQYLMGGFGRGGHRGFGMHM